MCVLRLCRLMVLGMVLWAATAEATTYYVGTTGNDSNNGTSLNTPFRTIGKAASVVNPGDVVNVRGGTYGEAVNINRGGALGNPVTFQRYQSEAPILQGPVGGSDGIVITVPNVTWDGIAVRGYPHNITLVDMFNSSSYTTIKNSELSGSPTTGLEVVDGYAGTLEIANNLIHDNLGDTGTATGNWSGMVVFSDQLPATATSFIWVHHNEVYNEGGAIKYKHASPPNPNATAIFEYNLVHDIISGGQACFATEQPGTIIRYNICYNVGIAGPAYAAVLLASIGGSGVCTGCQVYNNSFYNVTSAIYINNTATTGIIGHDNILYTTGSGSPGAGAAWIVGAPLAAVQLSSFDLYSGTAISKAALVNSTTIFSFALFLGLGYEAAGLTGDPLYVNPTGSPPDFHLRLGSPAKGTGTGGKDMGAYPTGTEIIGPTTAGGGSSTPPASPSNLRVQ